MGLSEWVPHLFWRLRRRPYAALVIAGDGFDGLAWVDGADAHEPIDVIELDDGVILRPTGLTIRHLMRRGAREVGITVDG